MGSFQQIVMGIGCLIAAFWFGSLLQDRPVGQNQTVALLPDGTIDPTQANAQPTLLEQTKGFVSSLFDSPSKPKPITVNDLRQRSLTAVPNEDPIVNSEGSFQSQLGTPHAPALPALKTNVRQDLQASSDGMINGSGVQRLVGSFASDQSMLEPVQNIAEPVQNVVVQRVAIVPDFSSLAEEVNRGLSFNDAQTSGSVTSQQSVELIPVPKFSDVAIAKPDRTLDADWERVRQQVATAERRLSSYRDEMTKPIPKIANSVTEQTNKFWDRQQSEARRQQSTLASVDRGFERERRLKPESYTDKQNRWDVFPANNRQSIEVQQYEVQQERQQPQPPQRRDYQDRQQPVGDLQARVSQPRFDDQQARRRNGRVEIVEVDRGFVTPDLPPSRSVQPMESRVRSLNDDRSVVGYSPSASSNSSGDGRWRNGQGERVAMQRPQGEYIAQRSEVRNDLRPAFNRDAGSNPEFVSPPEYRQPAQASQGTSRSEIVEAAKMTYGSFREYETRSGDTLQTISKEFYGSADYYYDLYLANRTLLSNPATVPPGMTLKIPRFDGR